MDIRVYTDGSALSNGSIDCKGGFGLVIVDNKDKILFEHTENVEGTTNNRMEMAAIIKAFELLKVIDYKSCIIYSDSEYCVKGYNTWMHNWFKDGFQNTKKKDLKNKDLWEKLYTCFIETKGVSLQWIKGHQNKNTWNDYIDDKIQQTYKKEKNMIKLDIPLLDREDQKILNKKIYSLELYDKYMKYEHDFCAEEVDYNSIKNSVDEYEDDILKEIMRKDPSLIEVCRKQHVYINKGDIITIALDKDTDDKEQFTYIYILSKEGGEIQLSFKTEREAVKILNTLIEWRWN